MSGKPSLLPEDGAIFVGSITPVAVGSFRASCRAEHDQLHSVVMEEQRMEIFPSKEEARAWIHQCAAARGFKTVRIKYVER